MAVSRYILSFETATGCGSVSLTSGTGQTGRLLAEVTLRPDITHSRKLLGSVQFIMDGAGISWQDLAAVAISMGPGSFTGLRIGMAAAKGIAMATGIPLCGVVSLDGLAAQYTGTAVQLCCLLDARKGQVYSAVYRLDAGQGRYCRVGDVAAQAPEALIASLKEPTLLAGPGIEPYYEYFAGIEQCSLVDGSLMQPRASAIGYLAAQQLHDGVAVSPAELNPLYARASEAEINARKKQG